MKTTKYTRKTYYIGTPDEQAITNLRERHGLSTDSDAVRYALRQLDRIEQGQGTRKRPVLSLEK